MLRPTAGRRPIKWRAAGVVSGKGRSRLALPVVGCPPTAPAANDRRCPLGARSRTGQSQVTPGPGEGWLPLSQPLASRLPAHRATGHWRAINPGVTGSIAVTSGAWVPRSAWSGARICWFPKLIVRVRFLSPAPVTHTITRSAYLQVRPCLLGLFTILRGNLRCRASRDRHHRRCSPAGGSLVCWAGCLPPIDAGGTSLPGLPCKAPGGTGDCPTPNPWSPASQ